MSKILIASKNPHKIEKLSEIVSPYFESVYTLKEANISDDIDEVGESFEEVASQKAAYISSKYDGYVIATDGGMLIPHLEKWNPIYTRRFYSGQDKSDESDFEKMDEILEMAKNLEGQQRKMQWKEAVAVAYKGVVLFSVEVDGSSGLMQHKYDKSKYKQGIWLCSLWCFPQFKDKNFFDLTPEEVIEIELSWNDIRDRVRDFITKKDKS